MRQRTEIASRVKVISTVECIDGIDSMDAIVKLCTELEIERKKLHTALVKHTQYANNSSLNHQVKDS